MRSRRSARHPLFRLKGPEGHGGGGALCPAGERPALRGRDDGDRAVGREQRCARAHPAISRSHDGARGPRPAAPGVRQPRRGSLAPASASRVAAVAPERGRRLGRGGRAVAYPRAHHRRRGAGPRGAGPGGGSSHRPDQPRPRSAMAARHRPEAGAPGTASTCTRRSATSALISSAKGRQPATLLPYGARSQPLRGCFPRRSISFALPLMVCTSKRSARSSKSSALTALPTRS
jgi:hypothetical protein